MKHAEFVHLHNHSQFSLLERATRVVSIVAVSIAGLMGTAMSSPWEDSFRNARVIRGFDTGGLPITKVWVAENTVVAGLQDGDSARIIVVWDTTGRELFRVSRRDTSLPVDNGHRLGLSLSNVSADGSTFALFQAWNTTFYDRSGDSLASFQSQPYGEFSPNGHFWMPWGNVIDYECEFEIRNRAGERLASTASDSESYWSGGFLSNGQALAYWTKRSESIDLPSLKCENRAERPAEFGDFARFSLTASSSGRLAALRGSDSIVLIVDSLGNRVREIGSNNAWDLTIDDTDSLIGILEYSGRAGMRIILAQISDSMGDARSEPLDASVIQATRLEFLPASSQDHRSVLLRSRGRLKSHVVTIDLNSGESVTLELPNEYVLMPGRKRRLIRFSGACDEEVFNSCLARSYSKIELVEIDF